MATNNGQDGDGDGETVYRHHGENEPPPSRHDQETVKEERAQSYWRANLKLLLSLMAVWFLASYGAGILFSEALDSIQFFGWPLGFWFAQQGSIYIFLILIVIYVIGMSRIDHEHGVDDDPAKRQKRLERRRQKAAAAKQ